MNKWYKLATLLVLVIVAVFCAVLQISTAPQSTQDAPPQPSTSSDDEAFKNLKF